MRKLPKEGLIAHFDASNLSTLWQNEEMTIPAEIGDEIRAWEDATGNTHALILPPGTRLLRAEDIQSG